MTEAPMEEAVRQNTPRNVVLATRVDKDDAEYIHGACVERGITMAEFLREAAIEWASR